MTRVCNADDFLHKFRKICRDYEELFRPRIEQIRKRYAAGPGRKLPPSVEQCLEAHCRAYVVNALLAALNWRLDARPEEGLPNLAPEAPIRSVESGTIRFLDYLGLERETDIPLLVVETKRPSTTLPQVARPVRSSLPREVIARGLAGETLRGEWSEWLNDIGDYVRSIYAQTKKAPRRVVLTNGDWLILFLDPSDTFLEEGTRDPSRILVFSNRFDIERRHNELFCHLEHSIILKEAPALTPGELPFYVQGEAVDRLMHGLRLRYIE